MNIHSCARTCPASRLLLVQRVLESGWKVAEAAEAAGISERTGYKWLRRYRTEGEAGLRDRSSRPRNIARQTCAERVAVIVELRRSRGTSPSIAAKLKMPISTVARILARAGLNKLARLGPKEPVRRYERSSPGELLHVDIKRLARFEQPGHRVTGNRKVDGRGRNRGYEYVHVAIDDHTRLAYVEVLQNQTGPTAAAFFRRAVAWYRRRGIVIQRVLSDNGPCYKSNTFAEACARRSVKHKFTRPYRPQTNGKAERFIQTMLREWAYLRPYQSHRERNGQLPRWLKHYNNRRPHGSLGYKSPAQRLEAYRAEQRA